SCWTKSVGPLTRSKTFHPSEWACWRMLFVTEVDRAKLLKRYPAPGVATTSRQTANKLAITPQNTLSKRMRIRFSYDVCLLPSVLVSVETKKLIGLLIPGASRNRKPGFLEGEPRVGLCSLRQHEIRKVLEHPLVLQCSIDDAQEFARQGDNGAAGTTAGFHP